jgi:fatty acid kinase fatty acid binding subunit
MSQAAIVTDSLADIPEPIMRELGILAVPTLVHFGDTTFRDKVDLTADEFYKRLAESPTLPTTSQPSPGAFEEVYRRLARETDQIISIHTTSAISGIYNSALIASRAVAGVHVAVIDSRQVTMALGWLVIMAARAARSGASVPEIMGLILDTIPRAHIIAMLDTLEYAQRSGRLGKASALLGTLLHVKPIVALGDGAVVPVEKVRTPRRGLERMAEIVLSSGPLQEIAVMHAAGQAHAIQLKEMLARSLDADNILIGETGPVLGTGVGPGAVGIAWVNGKY